MIRPYEKHDLLLNVDLTAAERLEPARSALRHAYDLLRQCEDTLNHAAPGLSDAKLQVICDAAEAAHNAAMNAAFLGLSGYSPFPVKTVSWTRQYEDARVIAEEIDRLAYLVDPYEYLDTVGASEEDINDHVTKIANDILHGDGEPYLSWLVEVSHDETQDEKDRERAAARASRLIRFLKEKTTA